MDTDERDGFVPLYVKIRDDIRRQIEANELRPGDRIPSLREIQDTYKVSSITSRRALLDLVNQGLVDRRGGVGTFVRRRTRRYRICVALVGYSEESWRQNSASFGQLVGGIAAASWQVEATLTVLPIADPQDAEQMLGAIIDEQGIDGLLLRVAGEFEWEILDALIDGGCTVVTIKRASPSEQIPAILPNAFEAGLRSTQHLIDLGHRRIGFIGSTASSDTFTDHYAGYVSALSTAGISVDDHLVIKVPNALRHHGLAACRRLHEQQSPPTAIVCNSDFLALGAYELATHIDLAIPSDLSVVGFDDMEFASVLQPPLTTVRLSYYDLGHQAAEHLVALLDGEERGVPLRTPVELLIRDSTAPPPLAAPSQ